MILADFLCDEHGPFEARAPSDVDAVACPICGLSSPWLPTPIIGRVKLGSVSFGGVEKAPTPYHLDTTDLAEGMPMGEWKERRRKVWREWRHKKLKEQS